MSPLDRHWLRTWKTILIARLPRILDVLFHIHSNLHSEFSKFKDATQAELTSGKMKTINGTNGTYKLVFARNIYPGPGVKTLDEARGYVVAEYQDHLEKQWSDKMRKEYPLKVNEKVFKSMVK